MLGVYCCIYSAQLLCSPNTASCPVQVLSSARWCSSALGEWEQIPELVLAPAVEVTLSKLWFYAWIIDQSFIPPLHSATSKQNGRPTGVWSSFLPFGIVVGVLRTSIEFHRTRELASSTPNSLPLMASVFFIVEVIYIVSRFSRFLFCLFYLFFYPQLTVTLVHLRR